MLPIAVEVNKDVLFEDRFNWQDFVHWDITGKSRPLKGAWDSHKELVSEIRSLQEELDIPSRLSDLGVTKEDIPELVRLSQGSSLSGNPKPISEAELARLLESML